MSDLLLEIGCENLPPGAIRPAFEWLRRAAGERLAAERLEFGEIYTTGTPRRLVLSVRNLSPSQRRETETVTGPPVSRAFEADGRPTKAASGFARAQGVRVADLERIQTERGEYVGIRRRLESKRTTALLKTLLPQLIRDVPFPNVMRWEAGGVCFARPIRWIVSLFGDRVIRFELAGVRSGDVSHTVPWIRRDRIRIRNAAHYWTAMKQAGVVVDHEERLRTIERLAAARAARDGVRLVEDPALLRELTYMLDSPRALSGSFAARYLKLPPEVVVTAMKAHQRYLAFRDRRGRLLPKFLTFTEGRVGSPATVRRGNEKVLRARLEDALFYWNEDVRTGIDGLAERLGSIVFIEGLGTLEDKARRVAKLARRVHEAVGEAGESAPDLIDRAARLAKADLASEMIRDGKEFTRLQGRIGSRYARACGEPDAIARAIAEQYLPAGPSDPLPRTALGTLLSVADRVDTITGCFLAGLTPSGSQDPYALRRQANGLMRILERRSGVSIRPLLRASVDAYRAQGVKDRGEGEDVLGALAGFFRRRAEALLKERGIAYDVVAAVSAVSWSRPAVAMERARAMQAVRGREAFELLITGAKRVGNILDAPLKRFGVAWEWLEAAFTNAEASGDPGFDPSLFEDDAERALLDDIRDAIPRMKRFDSAGDAASIFDMLSGLGPGIDRYFDRVLVNCPDTRIRENRHRFLRAVFALFSKYADFSCIVESDSASTANPA